MSESIDMLMSALLWLAIGMVLIGTWRLVWVLRNGTTSSGRRVLDVLREMRGVKVRDEGRSGLRGEGRP